MRRPILNIIWRNLLSPYINATNLNAMTNAINDNTQIIDEVVEDFDTLNSDVTENIQNLSERIHIQDGRIDVIAKTPEGGTTADAELRDIRVGADGTVYDNAGNAVRTQFDDVNNEINQLDNDKADNTEITRIDADIDTINETLLQNGLGSVTINNNLCSLDGSKCYAPLKVGDVITISKKDNTVSIPSQINIFQYDDDGNNVDYWGLQDNNLPRTITITKASTFLAFQNNIEDKPLMVARGNKALPYEPYAQSNKYLTNRINKTDYKIDEINLDLSHIAGGNLWTLDNSYSGGKGFLIPTLNLTLPKGKYRLEYDVTAISGASSSEFAFAKTGATDKVVSMGSLTTIGHYSKDFELPEPTYKTIFFTNSTSMTIANLKITALELGKAVTEINNSLTNLINTLTQKGILP